MRIPILPARLPGPAGIAACMVMLFLLHTASVAAAPPASARYQSVSGKTVVFVVEIGSPAPSSVIIQHMHPARRTLVGSSPRADKVNSARGVCKWLIKNSRSGIYPFRMTFDAPVSGKDIRLTLRYRNPSTKTFEEVSVRP